MNKDFIEYEQALALKELGFDESCFRAYKRKGHTLGDNLYSCMRNSERRVSEEHPEGDISICVAPLYQQVFKWFRKEHSLFHNIWNYTHCEPTDKIPNGFAFSIDEDWTCIVGKQDGLFEKYYNTYEEAELECLKKLIQLINEKRGEK